MRAAASWLGPVSTASVLRFFSTDSGLKMAARSLGFASTRTPGGLVGSGRRVKPVTQRFNVILKAVGAQSDPHRLNFAFGRTGEDNGSVRGFYNLLVVHLKLP